MDALDDYRSALSRLVSNSPVRLPVGTSISKDTVALEAGRGRGSIKKSRVVFSDLIREIDAAAKIQKDSIDKGLSLKDELDYYKSNYLKALDRELSLVIEIMDLKPKLAKASSHSLRIVK